jgi:hypothetical protein
MDQSQPVLIALPSGNLGITAYVSGGHDLCVAINLTTEAGTTCLGRFIFEDLCRQNLSSVYLGEHRFMPEPLP